MTLLRSTVASADLVTKVMVIKGLSNKTDISSFPLRGVDKQKENHSTNYLLEISSEIQVNSSEELANHDDSIQDTIYWTYEIKSKSSGFTATE